MHVAHLELANFRTFRRLEIDLQPGIHLVTGPNASGKTNLLEALALIATTRSARSTADIELISWAAVEADPLPAARVSARVEAADGVADLDVTVVARPARGGEGLTASRRFRVNGIARRASDLIGRLRVVMFSATDLGIISGAPALRRRLMDLTISQFEPAYVRALQRYARVLRQRNSLLRRLQERRGDRSELDFWDGEAAASGAVVLAARAQALSALGTQAAERYSELSPSGERLEICYRPALPPELASALASAPGEPALAGRLRDAFEQARDTDIRAGMTRIGPHRDDVAFLLGGHDAGAFASRGEQRGVALALRLAEVALSKERTGDPPLLLLDDILSELDGDRRERVLAAAYGVDQVLVTSADEEHPGPAELPDARRYRIVDGEVVSA